MSDACTGKLCQRTASVILKLDQAQWRGKRHRDTPNHSVASNLTANYGSPNRSNAGDPLMPYQALSIRGHVASGNAMEIYGSRHGANAANPHPVRDGLTMDTFDPLRLALYSVASFSFRKRFLDIDV